MILARRPTGPIAVKLPAGMPKLTDVVSGAPPDVQDGVVTVDASAFTVRVLVSASVAGGCD